MPAGSPSRSLRFYHEVSAPEAKLLLVNYLKDQGKSAPPPGSELDSIPTRLAPLTGLLFQFLLTDVHDTLVRRHHIRTRQIPQFSFLLEIHPMRRLCRKKLNDIAEDRLTDLVTDILLELSQRDNYLERLVEPNGISQSTEQSDAVKRPDSSSYPHSSTPPEPDNLTKILLLTMDYMAAFSVESGLCLDNQIVAASRFPVASGGYADVWKGFWKDQPVAIKVMRPFESTGKRIHPDKLLKRLWREFLSWWSLSHPNVVACLGFSYDFSPGRDVPSLISPWMSNGTVLSYLDKCPDVASRLKLILNIAAGLLYLHRQCPAIVHGDLRAGNVLVSDDGVARLTDFGLARILGETHGFTTTSELAGSMRWMSPELLRGESLSVSPSTDVWAFGMTTLEILSGKRPYHETKLDSVAFGQIIGGVVPSRPIDVVGITDEVWQLCNKCWEQRAVKRPSMLEINFDVILL